MESASLKGYKSFTCNTGRMNSKSHMGKWMGTNSRYLRSKEGTGPFPVKRHMKMFIGNVNGASKDIHAGNRGEHRSMGPRKATQECAHETLKGNIYPHGFLQDIEGKWLDKQGGERMPQQHQLTRAD